ncbi:MAG: hypothetical protein MZV63_65855 [Marinilabiliales bacterium]|nr:hypothetical protein [Marinilabiliales bacterium]
MHEALAFQPVDDPGGAALREPDSRPDLLDGARPHPFQLGQSLVFQVGEALAAGAVESPVPEQPGCFLEEIDQLPGSALIDRAAPAFI